MVFAEARIHCVNLLFIICLINIILMVFIALDFFSYSWSGVGWGFYSAHWDMAMWIPELYRWARIFS